MEKGVDDAQVEVQRDLTPYTLKQIDSGTPISGGIEFIERPKAPPGEYLVARS
jgi:hypothetical protein